MSSISNTGADLEAIVTDIRKGKKKKKVRRPADNVTKRGPRGPEDSFAGR